MRLFDEHIKRKVLSLDGTWDFITDEADKGEKEEWYNNFPENSFKVSVPACINNRFSYMEFQSIAWYKKEFLLKVLLQ